VSNTILLIGPGGENLGQVTMAFAENKADWYGLDLVEVRPGVYKILNLGKLEYEASKRKQTKAKTLKEMKFKLNIGENDFQTKVGHIRKFLKEGHNVKVTIWFSGREVNHPEVGVNLLTKLSEAVSDIATSTLNPELQGKNMYMHLAPGVKK